MSKIVPNINQVTFLREIIMLLIAKQSSIDVHIPSVEDNAETYHTGEFQMELSKLLTPF